jgi:hypothetical protein
MFDLRPLPFGGKLIKSPCSGNSPEDQFILVMSVVRSALEPTQSNKLIKSPYVPRTSGKVNSSL